MVKYGIKAKYNNFLNMRFLDKIMHPGENPEAEGGRESRQESGGVASVLFEGNEREGSPEGEACQAHIEGMHQDSTRGLVKSKIFGAIGVNTGLVVLGGAIAVKALVGMAAGGHFDISDLAHAGDVFLGSHHDVDSAVQAVDQIDIGDLHSGSHGVENIDPNPGGHSDMSAEELYKYAQDNPGSGFEEMKISEGLDKVDPKDQFLQYSEKHGEVPVPTKFDHSHEFVDMDDLGGDETTPVPTSETPVTPEKVETVPVATPATQENTPNSADLGHDHAGVRVGNLETPDEVKIGGKGGLKNNPFDPF